MIRKKIKTLFILFLLFIGIDIFIYWNLWNTFFQQDEWGLFGRAILHSTDLPFSIFRFSGAHFHPIGNIIWLIFYKSFGFNSFYYGLFAIGIHAFTACFSYFFFGIFIRRRKVRLLLSILFLVSFPTKQVVVWYAANPYIVPSVLGVFLFFIYLNNQKKKKNLSIISVMILLITWITSLLLREESAILIILFPLYIFLFWGKEIFMKIKKRIFVMVILIILLLAFRYILESAFGDNVIYEQGNLWEMRIYNFLLGPAKMLIQNIIDLEQLWNFARSYNQFAFPNRISDGLIIESAIFEQIVLFLLIPFLILLGYLYPRMKTSERKILLFSVVWIILSSAIVGLQSRRLHTYESRYLYLGSIGVLLFLYAIIRSLFLELKTPVLKQAIIVLVCSTIFVVYSYVNIQKTMNTIYLPYAKTRTEIIEQITTLYPSIPRQVVFYIECREKNDCFDNNLVLPFQSGVGHMLMVIYAQKNEKAYAPFFEDFYLWDWEEQGYKEIGGYGFGYYRERNKLYEDAGKGKFLPIDIIALSYDRSENKIENITEGVRNDVINSVKLQRSYGQE